jgi:uridine kinase
VTGPSPDLVEEIVAHALTHAPTLGGGRLICVDGPAGSGKTTLGTALGARLPAPVVHMDDLFNGWEGMDEVTPEVIALLTPLTRDEPGSYRRFDWPTDQYAERVSVEPVPVLVLEGVNAGNSAWAGLCTTLVWVETDPDTRLRRGMVRDGEETRAKWEKWMSDEVALFAREAPRDRADVVVRT